MKLFLALFSLNSVCAPIRVSGFSGNEITVHLRDDLREDIIRERVRSAVARSIGEDPMRITLINDACQVEGDIVGYANFIVSPSIPPLGGFHSMTGLSVARVNQTDRGRGVQYGIVEYIVRNPTTYFSFQVNYRPLETDYGFMVRIAGMQSLNDLLKQSGVRVRFCSDYVPIGQNFVEGSIELSRASARMLIRKMYEEGIMPANLTEFREFVDRIEQACRT